MKVVIRNLSSKKRSKKQYKELRLFAKTIANQLEINHKIKTLYLTYRDEWPHTYYPKQKPLGGFFKCWDGKRVSITFTGHWDVNMNTRMSSIVHELTHAKQMINKELLVFRNGKTVKWRGELNYSWKNFRFETLDGIQDRKKRNKYTNKHFPWEKEVQLNIKKFVKNTHN